MQPEEISIGIICPLPIEVAAMIQMLDERYSTQQFPRDPNLYDLGRIGDRGLVPSVGHFWKKLRNGSMELDCYLNLPRIIFSI